MPLLAQFVTQLDAKWRLTLLRGRSAGGTEREHVKNGIGKALSAGLRSIRAVENSAGSGKKKWAGG
ncbi:hypothetical protein HRbin36_00257 [bacterium HR36]|nr:hypothetical protein HRbin36_00257 [bacterium HR36]